LRQGQVDPVLHVDLGKGRVGANLEEHVEGHVARRGARRVHVDHVVGAVDLLLDGRRHVIGHDLGIGAGVGCRNRNLRRRNIRVLGDRQLGMATAPARVMMIEITEAKMGRSMQ
jgi:hypothetical protein